MKSDKEILEMAAAQLESSISSLEKDAEKYAKVMNEDYRRFFHLYSEDMYKVQLRLEVCRLLLEGVKGGSLDEVTAFIDYEVEFHKGHLLRGPVREHNANPSMNTAHLLIREVEQQVLRELELMLANIKNECVEK